ncbi:MAG: 30S ribosomal protein S19e [Candidatus Aenigmatarchaeota archaeon]|nr:30S ribosomal protein S19e [Candidatus Aenigmarchaeota archaeon]
MVSVREVDAQKFNTLLKEELKKIKEINPPAWSFFVKSGVHKERPPQQEDFWYVRSASVLRRLYLDGPVGVERLRSYFGGRKERGSRPAHFRKSSGSIIRKILQQLESAGLVEKNSNKGRKLTPVGRKLLDKITYEVSRQ